MFDINEASGFVDEAELEEIATGFAHGGTTPVFTAVSATVAGATAISALTFNATPCPTSSCTKSC